VQAGTVWINTYKQFSISTPFGGWRDSGLGREKGRWASAVHGAEEHVLGHQRAAHRLGRLTTGVNIMSVLGIDEITYGDDLALPPASSSTGAWPEAESADGWCSNA
jgi:hypothetical protein